MKLAKKTAHIIVLALALAAVFVVESCAAAGAVATGIENGSTDNQINSLGLIETAEISLEATRSGDTGQQTVLPETGSVAVTSALAENKPAEETAVRLDINEAELNSRVSDEKVKALFETYTEKKQPEQHKEVVSAKAEDGAAEVSVLAESMPEEKTAVCLDINEAELNSRVSDEKVKEFFKAYAEKKQPEQPKVAPAKTKREKYVPEWERISVSSAEKSEIDKLAEALKIDFTVGIEWARRDVNGTTIPKAEPKKNYKVLITDFEPLEELDEE